MLNNTTLQIVQSTVRAAGANSPGDKRRMLEAICKELGINPADSSAPTDTIIPIAEARRRLNMKPRTMLYAIKRGDIRAIRRTVRGKKPRTVGIAASEIEAYIQRTQTTGREMSA
jgi:hypothetical protein